MKKQIFSWGLMLAATFTLTNCAQELDNPVQPETEGFPFELVASTPEVKTVNDGMTTKWADGDKINVFHAIGETTEYVNDKAFTLVDLDEGLFEGTLTSALDVEEEYDWFAIYPNSEYATSPDSESSAYYYIGGRSDKTQTQKGVDNMNHIAGTNYPLYGKAVAVPAGIQPNLTMSHASALLKVKVTNTLDTPLEVNSISFTAPQGTSLVGTFYMNVVGSEVAFKDGQYVSNIANLTVSDANIEAGATASFYLAVKPFTAEFGTELKIAVNGYEKPLKMPKDVIFSAGKIKTLNFDYDYVLSDDDAIQLPWYEDFSGDLSQYQINNGGGETKLYPSDKLAGGVAPELLVAKNYGSFSANILTGGYVGAMTLTFKSNYPDRLSVTTSTSGVVITKVSNVEYNLNIAEAVESFELKFTNTNSGNVRLDDIALVKGVLLTQTLTFEQAALNFYIDSDEAASFTGQVVNGAKTKVTYSSSNESVASVDSETGVVILKDVEGSATITAVAVATEEYKEATASYIIAMNKKSEGGAKTYTFTITKSDFNTTSYSANNNQKTSTATAADGSTTEVNWTSYQVMQQSSTMQWKKKEGYIYNSTDLGTISDVTIEIESGTFTKYIGSSLKPTSNGTGGYFQINVGSETGKVKSIKVTFTK